MSSENTDPLGKLLNHPKVKKATGNFNDIAIERRKYQPEKCGVFLKPYTVLNENSGYTFKTHPECRKRLPAIVDNKVQTLVGADSLGPDAFAEYIRKRNIGIVFSGGPAPGGHNVIAGLYDACKKYNPESKIYGFLLGPDGIIENEAIEITGQLVNAHRNLGGFGMIKTGRTKIDTRQKVNFSRETCRSLQLDALVIVGGDDSNTNAAFLAQEMASDGIQVIGVPKPSTAICRSKMPLEPFCAPFPSAFTRLPGPLPIRSAISAKTAVQMSNIGMYARSWAAWPATWPLK